MKDKILDACAVLALFCFCLFASCLDSASPYDLLCVFGLVLACCEFALICRIRGNEW